MKDSPIIKTKNLSKIYKIDSLETIALENISISIHKGEFVAIMGPSGSGKSTLMHILGALDKPTSGEYLLDNKNVEKLTSDELADIRNRQIGFVFQAYNLLPRTTALKNVMLPMTYGGVPKEKRVEIAKEYLTMVGLKDRMEHTSNQLSGGQQQRVAIARALVMNPSIVLADEPTGNIASTQAEEIMKVFDQIHKKGNTIIMITHEPDIARCAQRIITIRDGQITDDHKNGSKIKSYYKKN